MGPLRNQRHERFVQSLFEGKPASRAFEEAGYAPNDGNAIRLKGNEKVQARLAELQAAAQRDSEVTVASLLRELEQARLQATDLKQFSAVVRSIESKARISGLLTERIEVKSLDEKFEDCNSSEDVVRRMHAEYRQRGYDLGEDDYVALRRRFDAWWEGIQAVLAASKAKPVQPAMSHDERLRIERRRLGLASRPNGNGNGSQR